MFFMYDRKCSDLDRKYADLGLSTPILSTSGVDRGTGTDPKIVENLVQGLEKSIFEPEEDDDIIHFQSGMF